jgi:hypothetical protein
MRKSAISRKRLISDRTREVSLSYSQVLWALQEIGLAHGSSPTKFAYYVKSLRKLGVPLRWNHGSTRSKNAKYHFEATMELAIALCMRVYGTLPDAIPQALKTHRKRLYQIYREARLGPESKLWLTASIEGSKVELSGVFLELGLAFEDGRCVKAGVPGALNSRQAIERFVLSNTFDRSWLPLNISKLASELVEAAGHAPPTRSTVSPTAFRMFREGTHQTSRGHCHVAARRTRSVGALAIVRQ